MERGSSKHGPRLDDQLRHETESLVRAGKTPHAVEWLQTEPIEDGHLVLPADHQPGARGMTSADVQRRSEIARYLPARALPMDRAAMLSFLDDTWAPEEIIGQIRALPEAAEFATAGEVVRALGIPTEE